METNVLTEKICHNISIGCDVHSDNVVCCCLQKMENGSLLQTKEVFPTNYKALSSFAEWCKALNPEVILMESTGNYWVSPYEALEEAALPINIVNPAYVKGMAGYKTDQEDAHWLAQIGMNGSYKPSYIPTRYYRHLQAVERSLRKQTNTLAEYKNRETKLFVTAGFRLGVFSDEFGKLATMAKNAILEGKTPEEVYAILSADSAFKRLKASKTELLEAFHGHMSDPLKKAILDNKEIYSFVQQKIQSTKEYLLSEVKRLDGDALQLLQTIPGIDELSAAIILIEIGGSEHFLSAFEKADSFSAWTGLCPGNNDSNSKRTGKKGRHGNRYLRQTFCESAQAAARTKGTTFQSKFQSLKIRLGFKRSLVAIAHKIAKMVFYVLSHHCAYRDPKIDYQALSCKRNKSRWLRQLVACEDLEIVAVNKKTGQVYDSKAYQTHEQAENAVNGRKLAGKVRSTASRA